MTHSHYVMDLYFPSPTGRGEPRREVLRISGDSDQAAIVEADRIGSWRNPDRYDVRAITKSSRTQHRIVHSVAAEPPPADEEQPSDIAIEMPPDAPGTTP